MALGKHIRSGSRILTQLHDARGLGHLAVQYSKALGYRTVAISSSAGKRDLALSLGADEYIDESAQNAVEELQKLGGADVIVCTAPSTESTLRMVQGLAFEGKLLAISMPLDAAQFSYGTYD
jgi:D-arabinose 1-dehydrogenase-like Zn-dependent alcohol dehydrogenase